jgi:hypothetical protein
MPAAKPSPESSGPPGTCPLFVARPTAVEVWPVGTCGLDIGPNPVMWSFDAGSPAARRQGPLFTPFFNAFCRSPKLHESTKIDSTALTISLARRSCRSEVICSAKTCRTRQTNWSRWSGDGQDQSRQFKTLSRPIKPCSTGASTSLATLESLCRCSASALGILGALRDPYGSLLNLDKLPCQHRS